MEWRREPLALRAVMLATRAAYAALGGCSKVLLSSPADRARSGETRERTSGQVHRQLHDGEPAAEYFVLLVWRTREEHGVTFDGVPVQQIAA
jgi:hypothetical protein